MGPNDYSLNVGNPAATVMAGFQTGLGITQIQEQRAEQQRQRQLQAQMQEDLGNLTTNPNPTAKDYADLTVKYPQLAAQFKQSWEMLGASQKEGKTRTASQAYAALATGRTDVAEKLLRDQVESMRNAGAPEEEIKAQEVWADMIKRSPEQARNIGGLLLSSVMGPDKFAETFQKLGQEGRASDMAPSELAKSKAEASSAVSDSQTKAVNAKFAESKAVMDLQKTGWDIKALEADIDIKRQNTRIAAMNAATSREGNTLKKQELQLKLEEAISARDGKIREKVATAESGAANIDNMLNTVQRILQNKSLDDVLGTIEGRMPALVSDEAADAVALIDTLGSQAFLAQIPNIKGMGALSNAEGEKLQSALQNLSRTQSEKQFKANLNEASRLLKKGREMLSKSTGVPLGSPDTPAAPGARPPLSSFESATGATGAY